MNFNALFQKFRCSDTTKIFSEHSVVVTNNQTTLLKFCKIFYSKMREEF